MRPGGSWGLALSPLRIKARRELSLGGQQSQVFADYVMYRSLCRRIAVGHPRS